MPDDDNDVPLPVPDPTRLSTEALTRGLKNERDYADGQVAVVRAELRTERVHCEGQFAVAMQRFDDIDKATSLLSETVNRVPTDLQKAVKDLKELMDERDRRVDERFDAVKTLRVSEATLNQTALQAALASAEKATAVASASLDRTIQKNEQLAAQSTDALGARVTQLTDQIIRVQQQIGEIGAAKVAAVEQKTETRGGTASMQGYVGMAVAILAVVIAAVSVIIGTR
jgi:DNA anti-recombination protein RmuC